MATIIQQPDLLSLSGNIKKFILTSGSSVSFALKIDGVSIFEATYEKGNNIEVDVKQLIEDKLTYKIGDKNFYEQQDIVKTFTVQIDDTSVTFRVIRCGVAGLADTPSNWLKLNFLTWQPQSKAVTYYSPEWLTYYAVESGALKLKAYYVDGVSEDIMLGALSADRAYTVNLQYAVVAGLLAHTYPTHYEVWAENAEGIRLSFIQRYYYSEPRSEEEQWFLFENSLGGIDTVRCYGNTDFEGDHEYKIAITDGTASEVCVDTKRIYSKNTGHLSDYERKWLLDFFPSRKKHIHALGGLRPIVVVDSDVKYNASDLPSNYTFKYRFADDSAALLNLIRMADVVPHGIAVPDIDSPDFFLPPRLVEFPRVPLSEGVLIPAFDPTSDTPQVTSIGAILASLIEETLRQLPGFDGTPGSGGQLINIIKEKDAQGATDNNVFSGLRTLAEIGKLIANNNEELKSAFLSRTKDDTAAGLIKFLQGFEIGNFTSGLLGSGGAFKMNNGISELEVDKLTVRMVATFFELVISKLNHIGGQIILSPARMKVTKVEDGGAYYRCYFDRGENNEVDNLFVAGDQARCQVFTGSGAKFYWRLVTSVGDDWINLSKSDCVGESIPAVGDDIVQLGNRTNTGRQSAQILSTVGDDAPSYKQYGGINSFSLEDKELTVFSSKGNKIVGVTQFLSGSSGLENIPEWNEINEEIESAKEEIQVVKDKRLLRVEKWATPGYDTYRENVPYQATLALKIFYDDEDVTATISTPRFVWYRISGSDSLDQIWNELHVNAGSSVDITNEDLIGDTSFVCQFWDESKGEVLSEQHF